MLTYTVYTEAVGVRKSMLRWLQSCQLGTMAASIATSASLTSSRRVRSWFQTLSTLKSLFGGNWEEQCSAFQYVTKHRDRVPQRERDMLKDIETIATHLEEATDL